MTYSKLVAIGGNLPNQGLSVGEILQSAVANMGRHIGRIEKISSWYRTPAFPAGSGPDYVNGAFFVNSDLNSSDFLAELHRIEALFWRERGQRWGARTVDLDLLSDGDAILPDLKTWWKWHDMPPERQNSETPDTVVLPHPRLHSRSFVLVPLLEICPTWVHPVLGLSVEQMHANLTEDDRNSVVKLADLACQ